MGLAEAYHVLQVSDLDTFASCEDFVAALTLPKRKGGMIKAVTMNGDRVTVDLNDMSITINGKPRPHPPLMLHDCGPVKSAYGSRSIDSGF